MAFHIMPINDLQEHEQSNTCECRPKLEIENGEMIFVHNAYDKRELFEVLLEEVNDKAKE